MARYAVYPTATNSPLTRKWIIRALILSLMLHAGFFTFAYWKKIDEFAFSSTVQQLTPPSFTVKQVTIDPETMKQPEEQRFKLPSSAPKPQDIAIPSEKPEPKEYQISPLNKKDIDSALLQDKPAPPDPINLDKLMKTTEVSAGAAEKQIGGLADAIFKETAPAKGQATITVPVRPGRSGSDAWEGIPGRQSIDDALSRSGPLSASDKPIAMPGGALFDYDRSELRTEALDDLQKLGELMRRNPNATFRIEGHTDASGTREYNLDLSLRRAEAVKAWLAQSLRIDPSRIETVGFGPDKLIVPADKSIDEQQPNRRVEIVIKTNRK